MNPLSLSLFFHFLGLIGLFVGYGIEWFASSKLRRSTTSDQARTWLGLYRASLPISGPGLLILIFSGGYMATITGSMKDGWMSASLLAILVALFIGFVLLLPRGKKIREALPEGATVLSGTALARVQDPILVTLIRVRFVLALGIVYLMTVKPATFSSSLIVLLVAIVLGALCAASSWRSAKSANT